MKKIWITFLVILAVAIIAFFAFHNKTTGAVVSENVAKCIGQNSILYVQKGCPHCEKQLELFGDNRKYINTIDCFYFPEKCSNIQYTPTWEINGKQYVGVQTIEKLKELTGCK